MRRFRLIAFIVFSHLLALIILGKSPTLKKETPSPQKIAVQTITLKPPPPKPQPQKAPTPSTPKPVAKKPQTKKKPAPKKEVAPKQKSQKELLNIAKAALEELQSPTQKPLAKLQSESQPIQVHEANYSDQIIAYLQDQLTLPERGEVKMRLVVAREGKVTSLKILSSNDNNRSYIEKALPGIVLPSFGSRFKGEKNHTFSLTLTTLCD